MPTRGGAPGRTAIQEPSALLGIGAALAAAAAVAWLAFATLVPQSPVSHPGRAVLALGVAALALVVLKLVAEPYDLDVGAWASVLLAALVIGAATELTKQTR